MACCAPMISLGLSLFDLMRKKISLVILCFDSVTFYCDDVQESVAD